MLSVKVLFKHNPKYSNDTFIDVNYSIIPENILVKIIKNITK
jgi:hypothetical protein